jgi:hypothetical protein
MMSDTGRSETAASEAALAREKWEFERDSKAKELALRETELRRSQWSNPLVLAILTAAAAGAANFVVARNNGNQQAAIEREKAEQALVLEAIRTNGDVRKSAENLNFLVETGLLTNQQRGEAITKYLKKAPAGTGPTLASAGSPAPAPSGNAAAPHYDFPIFNGSTPDPEGWDIDVFSCAQTGASMAQAEGFTKALAARADTGRRIGGEKLGRIRFTSGKSWAPADIIVYDTIEAAFANALLAEARSTGGREFRIEPNKETPTPYYLSVFFCRS